MQSVTNRIKLYLSKHADNTDWKILILELEQTQDPLKQADLADRLHLYALESVGNPEDFIELLMELRNRIAGSIL